jgi:hypothetical protein
VRVPEIAVEGEDVELLAGGVRVAGTTYEALVLDDVADVSVLRAAHDAGRPVVVRATSAEEVRVALARPEVACAAVPPAARALRELDLTELTYG